MNYSFSTKEHIATHTGVSISVITVAEMVPEIWLSEVC